MPFKLMMFYEYGKLNAIKLRVFEELNLMTISIATLFSGI